MGNCELEWWSVGVWQWAVPQKLKWNREANPMKRRAFIRSATAAGVATAAVAALTAVREERRLRGREGTAHSVAVVLLRGCVGAVLTWVGLHFALQFAAFAG